MDGWTDENPQDFRKNLGFSNKEKLRQFYKGADITRPVNTPHLEKLNERLKDIILKVNSIVHSSIRIVDLDSFIEKSLTKPYTSIIQNNLLPQMSNQGRAPEDVYYNWMRGHIFAEYFKKTIALIFEIEIGEISDIGKDDFSSINTFKRSPTADLQVKKLGKTFRIEMQTGYTGLNDIKQHKWKEAVRSAEDGDITVVMHIDLSNGGVAFIRLDSVALTDINWVTRQQMEGQTVYNIDAHKFTWRLSEKYPSFAQLDIS
jgi:hypothetical protein